MGERGKGEGEGEGKGKDRVRGQGEEVNKTRENRIKHRNVERDSKWVT